MMSKRTKALKYTRATADKVFERDNGECLFCKMLYEINGGTCGLEFNIMDIAHFIPRSQSGLGIEQNLVLLCRYHHSMLDNGNNGKRGEMLKIIEEYLKSKYPDWNKEGLRYDKYKDY